MNKYLVMIPVTGYLEVEVEAENREGAIDKAWENATLANITEWTMHEEICTGNVCHAALSEVDVTEIKE